VLKATDGAYSSGGVGLRVVDSAATFTNLKIEPLTK
jgi:hypothetical protein